MHGVPPSSNTRSSTWLHCYWYRLDGRIPSMQIYCHCYLPFSSCRWLPWKYAAMIRRGKLVTWMIRSIALIPCRLFCFRRFHHQRQSTLVTLVHASIRIYSASPCQCLHSCQPGNNSRVAYQWHLSLVTRIIGRPCFRRCTRRLQT